MPAILAWAVRAINVESKSSGSDVDSSGWDTDSDRRNVYMAATADRAQTTGDSFVQNERFDEERQYDRIKSQTVCTHCRPKRHDDRGCWKRLTCQKCGRKGHPVEKCYHICSVCKNVHDEKKCPKEHLYNKLCQWCS